MQPARRLWLLSFLVGIVILVVAFRVWKPESLKQTITVESDKPSVNTSPTQSAFKKLIRENRHAPITPEIEQKFESNPEEAKCLESYKKAFEFPLADNPDLTKLPRDFSCSVETETVSKVHREFSNQCATETLGKDIHNPASPNGLKCTAAFTLYRAHIDDWIHRDDDISQMTDMHTLANIMLASAGVANVVRVEAAAVRMNELAPNMYEPRKAIVISKAMRAAMQEEAADDADMATMMAEIENTAKAAQEISNNDPELQEALIMAKTRMMKDRDRLEPLLEELKAQGQSGKLIDYYEAGILWNKGQREEGLEKIRALTKQYPDDERFKATLENLLKDPKGENKGNFSVRLGVNFDIKD